MMHREKGYRFFWVVLIAVLAVCAVLAGMISGGRSLDSAAAGDGDMQLTTTTGSDTVIDVIEFDDLRDMATYEQN